MKDFLVGLLTSKKFIATLASVIVWLCAQLFSVNVSEAELALLMGAVASFVIAQGVADHKKEAAKELAKAAAAEPVTAPARPSKR